MMLSRKSRSQYGKGFEGSLMRYLGNVETEQAAARFQNYMITRDVQISFDEEDGSWALWVRDEDQLDEAKTEYQTYQGDPDNVKYLAAAKVGERIRAQELRKQLDLARKNITMRKRWEQPRLSDCQITMGMILISLLVAMFSTDFSKWNELCNKTEPFLTYLYMVPVRALGDGKYEVWIGLEHIRRGEIWRLFTPMFIHLSYLHFVFNMYWFKELGATVEYKRGKFFFILLVLTVAGISNYAQYYFEGPLFGGMSGVLYGLFGYIWIKSRYDPKAGFFMLPNIVFWMIAWLLLCYTGAIGPIANTAHTAGLITGMVIAGARPMYQRLTDSKM